jgi:hypothetical protein
MNCRRSSVFPVVVVLGSEIFLLLPAASSRSGPFRRTIHTMARALAKK